MNTHTHFHHAEDFVPQEHRLIFMGAEAAEAAAAEPEDGIDAPLVGVDDPSKDGEDAGEERKEGADALAKKEEAAIDALAKNLGMKMMEGADAAENRTDVMAKVKADLLATLREGLGGEKRTKPPEKIAEDIRLELAKIPFDPETDDLTTYIETVTAKADQLIRTHPDIVAATSAVDAEKGIETPLTPKELGEAKKLLSDGTLKQMQEFLAKGNKDVQQSLAKLWLGAQGFSVDDSVTELKAENLTVENTHKVEGMGQLISMAVLAFTVLHLLKQKTEELKKTVSDGVKEATGEGTPEGDATPEAGEEAADTSGVSEERKQELRDSIKADGIDNTVDNRKQDVDLAKDKVGLIEREIGLLKEKSKILEVEVENLRTAPAGETDVERTARTDSLAVKEGELSKTTSELQAAETNLTKAKEDLNASDRELAFLQVEKATYATNKGQLIAARANAILNLRLPTVKDKPGGQKLADALNNSNLVTDDDHVSMKFDGPSFAGALKDVGNTVLGSVPSSEEMGLNPVDDTVTDAKKLSAFLTMLTEKIEEGEAPKAP